MRYVISLFVILGCHLFLLLQPSSAPAACRIVDETPAGLLGDVVLADGTVIDTDTGDITNGPTTVVSGGSAGVGLAAQDGGPYAASQLRVYDFRNLTIPVGATVAVVGANGLAFLASESITISGTLDVSGNPGSSGAVNVFGSGGIAGPGGHAGGEFLAGSGCVPGNGAGNGPGGGQEGGCGPGAAGGDDGASGGGGGGGGGACGGGGGGGGSHAVLGETGETGAVGITGQPGYAGPGIPGVGGVGCTDGVSFSSPGTVYGEATLDILYGGSGGASGGFGGFGGFGGDARNGTRTAYGGAPGLVGGPGGGGGGGGAVFLCATVGVVLTATGVIDAGGGDGGPGASPAVSEAGGTSVFGNDPVGGGGGGGRSGAGGGGGGGAGGSILVTGGVVNILGSLDVSGGLGGASSASGTGGFGGAGRDGGATGGTGGAGGDSGAGGDGGEGYVLVVDGVSGVLPSEFDRILLHGAVPNPFNPRTTISFDLPSERVVSLRIYDVAGRLVDTLLNGEWTAAGRNEIVWGGSDARGRAVSAGTYYYRLETAGSARIGKMVLLK